MEVNIHRAKTNLSQLIVQAEAGEDVVIARAGKPVVRLVPVQPDHPKTRKAGALKDVLKIAPDAFSPEVDEMIAGWFNNSPLLYTEADRQAPEQQNANKSARERRMRK